MEIAEYAAQHGLKRMGARPPFGTYIKDAWARRDFAIALSKFTNDALNARNRLGRWWMVLLPTIQATTYGLIFGIILGDNRPDNFLPFLFTGVFLFSFFSSSFSTGASSLTSNNGLVKSLSFPRILLPISAVIRQLINLLPQIAVLLVLVVIIQRQVTWSWFGLIPVVLLMIVFSAGLAMVSARLTTQVRDFSNLIPFITRIMFYTSGIFFSIDSLLDEYPTLMAIMKWNPVYDFIELGRGALVTGHSMEPQLWIGASVWAFGLFILGTVYFWKAEERYGRD